MKSNSKVEFPSENGNFETFSIYQTEVMSSGLADQFPDIKTYIGVSESNKNEILNLTITSYGVYGMITKSGASSFINPISYSGDVYMVFNKNQAYTDHLNAVVCEVQEQIQEDDFNWGASSNLVDNTTLKRYRLALACTGEYAEYHISAAQVATSAPDQVKKDAVLAAMVVSINRINSIYERDLAINLQLIDNNEDLIQLDPDNDPYTNNSGGVMLGQNQTQVDNVIGTANYDIGHVFSTGGGGIASSPSVCNPNFKAQGVTGSFAPVGDPFDVDYVAHEIGHQFGASHTFNNFCGGNRTNSTAVETGSGSTIMAYANVCPPNVQSASDDYFHVVSISQIQNYVTNSTGSFCSEDIGISNNPPTIDVELQDYTIPSNTAFFLEVEASDADGDVLTYTWEQLDNEISNQPPESTNTNGPSFRSLPPTTSPRRYFPDFTTVLNGSLSSTWEVIPDTAREMEFGVLVRDNNSEGGQSELGTTEITFVSDGPFSVTSQNTSGIIWQEGDTETITWDVANTNNAPVNSPEVDILLSTDSELDFDVVLASNVPNNGSADIIVPNIYGPSCRIMVKASNSIFYAVNEENFTIDSDVSLTCFTPENNTVLNIPDGNGENEPGTTVSSSINFDQDVVIETINVQVDISHTYIQDLIIELTGPNDESLVLLERECDAEDGIVVEFNDEGSPIPDNCTNPLSGTFQPSNGSLNQWVGSIAEGEWTLSLTDWYNQDDGQLNSWSLEICTTSLSTINQEANKFSIIPNPNNGKFQVNFSTLSGAEINGKLYNLQGRLIENLKLEPGILKQEVQFDNLQQGMYLFQINDGENTLVEKLIIR
ncbi:reprolysin-like metallopeptidase [Psychroflexus planctonicus]|nr:zinc-dependent metalloprotease family protein [Psychroflexus planctonicus]